MKILALTKWWVLSIFVIAFTAFVTFSVTAYSKITRLITMTVILLLPDGITFNSHNKQLWNDATAEEGGKSIVVFDRGVLEEKGCALSTIPLWSHWWVLIMLSTLQRFG